MALVHPNATLSPSKRELMGAWLPTRPWHDGTDRKPVGSFRFDDPAGAVGMEGFLLGADGVSTLFLPLTYRGAPLDGADEHLVGTTEHSELGTRWVYDGCGDPVFVSSLAHAILAGATGVDHEFEGEDGSRETMPTNAQVRGSGSADTEVAGITEASPYDEGPLTLVNAGPWELVVARVVGTELSAAQTLAVSWKGGADVVIAGLRPA
jgi:hypothetical protein